MRLSTATRLVAVLAVVALAGTIGLRAAQATEGELGVTIEYKGTGTVDQDHRVWIWLFDTPNITADTMPLATGVVAENGKAYQFVGLPKEVYIAAAYDEKGGYDGSSGPPPQGTPITIHGMATSGAATAVPTGGVDAKVVVAFDDSMRMP